MSKQSSSIFDPKLLRPAIVDAFRKLDPRVLVRNPVMFVVEVVSVATTVIFFRDLFGGAYGEAGFTGQLAVWLWFTVLFANLAEAVAEGRGKAQADTLRKTRTETSARRRRPDGTVEECPSTALKVGDCCVVEAGQVIPGDGEVIEGIASVDE